VLEPQDIHGWDKARVQTLQQQVAKALGRPVAFRDRLKGGGEGPEMVVIPPGRFLMGSPYDERSVMSN
jgi:formylglycine-generating enzyme required for sulfatase activity